MGSSAAMAGSISCGDCANGLSHAVDVQIVRVLNLGTMQFAAAYEQVNEAVEVRESRLLHGGDELFGTGH
jgi:hypothetical protein